MLRSRLSIDQSISGRHGRPRWRLARFMAALPRAFLMPWHVGARSQIPILPNPASPSRRRAGLRIPASNTVGGRLSSAPFARSMPVAAPLNSGARADVGMPWMERIGRSIRPTHTSTQPILHAHAHSASRHHTQHVPSELAEEHDAWEEAVGVPVGCGCGRWVWVSQNQNGGRRTRRERDQEAFVGLHSHDLQGRTKSPTQRPRP